MVHLKREDENKTLVFNRPDGLIHSRFYRLYYIDYRFPQIYICIYRLMFASPLWFVIRSEREENYFMWERFMIERQETHTATGS